MANQTITCETCGQRFEWKKSLAGKTVRCKCGGIFVVPKTLALVAPVADLEPPGPLPPTAPRFNPPKKEIPHRYTSAYDEEGQRREEMTRLLLAVAAIALLACLLFAAGEFLARRAQETDQTAQPPPPPTDYHRPQPLPVVTVFNGAAVYDNEIDQLIAWGKSHEFLSWMKVPGHGVVQYLWTRDLLQREGDAWYKNGAKTVLVFGEVWTTFIAIELPPEPDRRKYFFDYTDRFRQSPAGHGPPSIVTMGASPSYALPRQKQPWRWRQGRFSSRVSTTFQF